MALCIANTTAAWRRLTPNSVTAVETLYNSERLSALDQGCPYPCPKPDRPAAVFQGPRA